MINGNVSTYEIVNGIDAGLCLLDREFHIVWINKFESEVFGPPQEVCGRHCYEVFHRRDQLCRGCPVAKVFKEGRVQRTLRSRLDKDGNKLYCDLTISPIKDNNNEVVYALELSHDATELMMREKRKSIIIRKLRRLYQGISSENRQLCLTTKKLKEITASLNTMYHKKVSELADRKKELEDIFQINRVIASSSGIKKVTSMVAKDTCELIHTDGCLLRLFDTQTKKLAISSSFGISEPVVKGLPALKLGENICGEVAKSKKPLAIYDLENDPRINRSGLVKNERFKSLLGVPIKLKNKVLGVICTFSRKKRKFTDQETGILTIFASQVAIAIQEARHCEEAHANYFNTIHALVLAIEARDPYTRGHTERVTRYALKIGRALRLPEYELQLIRYSGEMHDVGKISIPDFILSKPGKLTPSERATIELHPTKGAEMLEPLDFLRPAIPIVRHHHERYDGTGYPDGLEKEKIPLVSRILACADAFDAMTSDRPYRKTKFTIEEALSEIKKNAGSQFDPKIAHLFIKTISVQLS